MTHYQSSLFSQDIFQELEFTGVMRFYYQAQDLGSGQKVGHVQCFSGHNKSVPHSRPVLYCNVLFVSERMRILGAHIHTTSESLIPLF